MKEYAQFIAHKSKKLGCYGKLEEVREKLS